MAKTTRANMSGLRPPGRGKQKRMKFDFVRHHQIIDEASEIVNENVFLRNFNQTCATSEGSMFQNIR